MIMLFWAPGAQSITLSRHENLDFELSYAPAKVSTVNTIEIRQLRNKMVTDLTSIYYTSITPLSFSGKSSILTVIVDISVETIH